MAQYCRDRDGVGLAAPQVGIYKQFAILMVNPGDVNALINPVITRFAGRDLQEKEGCLSLPPGLDNQQPVVRSEIVDVECGTLEDPQAMVRTTHKGMMARIIQHEVDHLNPEGEVFFIDRIGAVKRGIVTRKFFKHLRTGVKP